MRSIVLIFAILIFSSDTWATRLPPPTPEEVKLYNELMEIKQKDTLSEEDLELIQSGLNDSFYLAADPAIDLVILHRLKDLWDNVPLVEFGGNMYANLTWGHQHGGYANSLFARPDYLEVSLLDAFTEKRKSYLPLKDGPLKGLSQTTEEWQFGGKISLLDLITIDLCLYDQSPNNDYARERLEPYHLFERQKKILNNEPGAIGWFAWEHNKIIDTRTSKQITLDYLRESDGIKQMLLQETLSEEDKKRIQEIIDNRWSPAQRWAVQLILLHRLKNDWETTLHKRFGGSNYLGAGPERELLKELFARDDYQEVALLDMLRSYYTDKFPKKNGKYKDSRTLDKNWDSSHYSDLFVFDLVVMDICFRDPSPNNDYARKRLAPYHLFKRHKKILNNEPGALIWYNHDPEKRLKESVSPVAPIISQ